MGRDKSSSDPDQLQERTLKILEKVIGQVEQNPTELLDDRAAMQNFIQVSEHLRKLNSDRYSVLDARSLSKLSEAELDEEIERMKGETNGQLLDSKRD